MQVAIGAQGDYALVWLDTLCCLVHSTLHRNLFLRHMSRIYSHAACGLILDRLSRTFEVIFEAAWHIVHRDSLLVRALPSAKITNSRGLFTGLDVDEGAPGEAYEELWHNCKEASVDQDLLTASGKATQDSLCKIIFECALLIIGGMTGFITQEWPAS
jgi:hypothetical protein